jgi:spore coat protein A, manganese oxidase
MPASFIFPTTDRTRAVRRQMPLSRRQLLTRGLGVAAAWATGGRAVAATVPAVTTRAVLNVGMRPGQPLKSPLHPPALAHFVDALPIPEVAHPYGARADPTDSAKQLPYYRLTMREVEVQVHRDLKPTRCWSFGTGVPGPTFETKSGHGLLVEWVNALPKRHLFPVDHTICGAGANVPEVRTVPHVHGARVPPQGDGYPEHWFTQGKSALYHYPNRQDATTLWYHDHAMGIERLNQYAGLFGAFLIRDQTEAALELPSGPYDIPLFLFDRLLDGNGQLQYPTSGVPESPWVSEVYGDALLVNGKLYPYLEVEPRPYRFRLVNASNSRFYYLSLSNRQSFHQIGTDQGLLSAPLALSSVTLAPGERVDLLIDFSVSAKTEFLLKSQSFELMQFRVSGKTAAGPGRLPATLRPVERISRTAAVETRALKLNEFMDPKTHAMVMLLNDAYWRYPVTEKPALDTIEVWELVNFTEDTHPIHLHLVRFQLLDRQHFDVDAYNFEHKFQTIGEPILPDASEAGWKDTIQAYPGMITRIIIPFRGYPGRYVWHCHVLEHAANEMMRPFEVVQHTKQARRL